jgi:hypothetical protein
METSDGASSPQPAHPVRDTGFPYPPSWLDRLTAWVRTPSLAW